MVQHLHARNQCSAETLKGKDSAVAAEYGFLDQPSPVATGGFVSEQRVCAGEAVVNDGVGDVGDARGNIGGPTAIDHKASFAADGGGIRQAVGGLIGEVGAEQGEVAGDKVFQVNI